jgi:hypothetical protein
MTLATLPLRQPSGQAPRYRIPHMAVHFGMTFHYTGLDCAGLDWTDTGMC